MLYLALTCRPDGAAPVVAAARNVHKAFVYAAALLDLEVVWLYPEEGQSICSCPITADSLERTLAGLAAPPAAVYVTSPDYLGGMANIGALAQVAHRYGTVLAVDNAHGAYLHFLTPAVHPLDLGADLCCDSAHKTLPVLTGGAYLHIATSAPAAFGERARAALALFGSTSPSYLTLASLDLCNRYLAEGYSVRLAQMVERLDKVKAKLTANGWQVEPSDPLRLTIDAPAGRTGIDLAERLRKSGVECEFADGESIVMMATPENDPADLERVMTALGENHAPPAVGQPLSLAAGERVLSIREALLAPQESVPVEAALGRVCGTPTVSCPPAIPIAVSGERIGAEALNWFQRYGIKTVDVLKR
jgi:arginine/lysine/ornithine decarboxylase